MLFFKILTFFNLNKCASQILLLKHGFFTKEIKGKFLSFCSINSFMWTKFKIYSWIYIECQLDKLKYQD